jgi:hypothetical protein
VHAGQLVGGVNLLIARPTQRRLVRAAQHRRLRHLTNVALYLHPFPPSTFGNFSFHFLPLSLSLSLSLSVNESQNTEKDEDLKFKKIGVW